MARFFLRHWTGTVVVAALLGWAVFYLPGSPTLALFELKQAVDARNGDAAVKFVDFDAVVKNAGRELADEKSGNGGDVFSRMLAEGAVALLSKPAADAAQAWLKQKVDAGAPELQIPGAAAAGAVLLLHRDGDTAYTKFRDRKGQVWEIHMARNGDGRWQIVQVKDIRQILERLQPQTPQPANSP